MGGRWATRHQRIRARGASKLGRRGGRLKARVLNHWSERRPARPACSQVPLARMVSPYHRCIMTAAAGKDAPNNFIPGQGRIERLWGTFQDRLVSELRRAKTRTLAEANAVLAA